MIHFDGSGTRPSGPSQGKNGVIGMYGTPSRRASDGTLPDERVDLLGADDRARDDRYPVRIAAETKPPRPKRCSL